MCSKNGLTILKYSKHLEGLNLYFFSSFVKFKYNNSFVFTKDLLIIIYFKFFLNNK